MLPSLLLPRVANAHMISSVVTSFQKLAFILSVGICLYNGTIFNFLNNYLTPNKSAKPWLSFFRHNSEECNGLKGIFLRYNCKRNLLIVDDTEVHKAISNMTPFAKCRYLMIVRSGKALAPYLFHICVMCMLSIALITIYFVAKKILQEFGINLPWPGSVFQKAFDFFKSYVLGSKLISAVPGFVFCSWMVCLFTSQSDGDQSACHDTTCLLCFIRLSKTLFKDFDVTGNKIFAVRALNLMYQPTALLVSIILTVFMYSFAIILGCLIIYILVDTLDNVWPTGNAPVENVTNSSPGIITTTWNRYVPSFREAANRLIETHKANNGT